MCLLKTLSATHKPWHICSAVATSVITHYVRPFRLTQSRVVNRSPEIVIFSYESAISSKNQRFIKVVMTTD